MKKLVLSLSIIVLLCGSFLISNAVAKQFTVLTEDYAPFNYTENGKLTGLSTDLMSEVLKRVGHPNNIRVMLWHEAYEQTMQNPNCILYSTTRTKERENLFKWVGPLASNKWVFYAKKGNAQQITTLDDARKVKKIGTCKDTAAEQFLKKEGFTNLVSAADDNQNVSKLISGDIDIWIVGELQGIHKAKTAGIDPSGFNKVFDVKDTQLYIAFNKKTPDKEISKWQKALDELKDTKIYKQIMSKYL